MRDKYIELTKEDFINRNMITKIELPPIKENISFQDGLATMRLQIATVYEKEVDKILLSSLYELYKGKADEVIVIDEVEFEKFIKRFLPIYLEEQRIGKRII